MDATKVVLWFGLILTVLNIINTAAVIFTKVKGSGTQNANVTNTLEVLKSGNAAIQNTLDKMDEKMNNFNDRLIRVEESCKSAHHRIDGWEVRQHD